jgi:enoyl-CoA hydratase
MPVKLPHVSTPDVVTVERAAGVALVTLNRPEKRNALSLELRARLTEDLNALAHDDEVRCVLLTGAGSAFCAGMDTSEFGGDHANKKRIVELSIGLFRALGSFPKPVVAAINGPAVAGGFALALLCDLRLASTDARMGFVENKAGIPPSYAAARAALPAALAAELCLTGRLLDADVAGALGVVSEVRTPENLMPRAQELTQEIAGAPPSASIETKRRILIERETCWRPLFEAEEQALGASGAGAEARRRTRLRASARWRRPRRPGGPLRRSPARGSRAPPPASPPRQARSRPPGAGCAGVPLHSCFVCCPPTAGEKL